MSPEVELIVGRARQDWGKPRAALAQRGRRIGVVFVFDIFLAAGAGWSIDTCADGVPVAESVGIDRGSSCEAKTEEAVSCGRPLKGLDQGRDDGE